MFEVDVNGRKQRYNTKPTMNVDTTGSSGSIPKPLTYDYMPEGYPKKGIETVTLMEEQEVTFSENSGLMGAISPVVLAIKQGDKLTVVWDGVSYDVVVKGEVGGFWFGNQAISDPHFESTDEPFLYWGSYSLWYAADTSATHTIKVMRQQATYTPMDANYMPSDYPNEERVTEMINAALGVIENGSY